MTPECKARLNCAMSNGFEIRRSGASDWDALEALYGAAFPDEDLLPLLRDLLAAETGVLSLAALRDGQLIGHVAFTVCRAGQERVCLLAPLAVHPDVQREGAGIALVEAGLSAMKADGSSHAFTLGDPNYYGRFGFEAEHSTKPPYVLPDKWRGAWQSLGLSGETPTCECVLQVPAAWAKPELWAE